MSKGRGYAVKLPLLNIAEVGASGGSLVAADPLETILVGPHSAGAVPGPACYAAGGARATVTDAYVVLLRVAARAQRWKQLPGGH